MSKKQKRNWNLFLPCNGTIFSFTVRTDNWINPLIQIHNNCPEECPFFRRDKGCIATVCLYRRPKFANKPVKPKETEQHAKLG